MLDGQGVVGHSMFDFITGDDVRGNLSRFLHRASLRGGAPPRLMSRCDSPTVRRELWIVITPVQQDSVFDGACRWAGSYRRRRS
ncbi:MAG TPA: hypothetical protein VLR47_10175 [Rhodospirillales bacterium]|nr:hypothetical protein [Rhodospirillales bacterium]